MVELSQEAQAAAEILYKRKIRADLVAWAEHYGKDRGWTPALHHRFLLEKLQNVVDGKLLHSKTGLPCRNLIIMMPPGSAKSTYGSIIFPPWAIQRWSTINPHDPNFRILACSYAADLIESFSRECRNSVEAHHKILGFNLEKDSRAVQEWSTDNGCTYRCAGVGAGISGRRADCGIIDDYLGSEEDADSKTVRDKQWAWYTSDFWSRLKPNSIQIIIANRRHEEDLIGRLIDETNKFRSPVPPSEWEVIRLPFFAEEDDQLGRPVGERLWSDWFTDKMEQGIKLLSPRTRAGLYQQRPAPEEGSYFLNDYLKGYTYEEYEALLKTDHRVYGAGDWAVSEDKGSDYTCIGGAILSPEKIIYILPDLFWEKAEPRKVLSAYLAFLKRRNPLMFWSESGHISKSWGPFLRDMMLDDNIYNCITEVTVSKDKEVRAQSIRGFCSMYRVRFPHFAPWWSRALHELLTFPGGSHDDFVDMIAHLGRGISSMVRGTLPKIPEAEDINKMQPITLSWVKESDKTRRRSLQPAYQDR